MTSTLASPPSVRLYGRRGECDALDRLLDGARAGQSGVLVLSGEAGVGKTALLEYAIESAPDLDVLRASGVQSEMELAFAALHQFCAPLLSSLDRLPGPQSEALRTTFGLEAGAVPDRFFVGLAVLGLLSDAADQGPLLCVVDDAQWLDRASADTFAFVARRLLAESVVMLFATRGRWEVTGGLPELALEGLAAAAAYELLVSVVPGRLDERVAAQLVAETRGNPLALLELPRGLSPAQLAGGFGLPAAGPVSAGIEESFRRRLAKLPRDARRLLLLAAADPLGDPALVWRAAGRLGIPESAAQAVESEGLLSLRPGVAFRHPLVRSAVYRAAGQEERSEVHRALAEATDPQIDPDRRAWHRAQAASVPDEEVASELERSADRAQARGGFAAAAAFLERSAALTLDPSRRAHRAAVAAQTKFEAGAFDDAVGLLATAEAGALSELERAQVDVLRARIEFASTRGSHAPLLLLEAARRLSDLDPALARETFLEALSAAMFAGRLAEPGGRSLDVAKASRAAPSPADAPRATDLVLDGLTTLLCESYEAAAPILRRAQNAFDTSKLPAADQLRWKWLATVSAVHLWDDARWEELSERHVQLAREKGALGQLPLALSQRVYVHLFAGELAVAASLVEEIRAATEATGSPLAPYGAVGLLALRGREAEAVSFIESSRTEVTLRGEGIGISVLDWAEAVLHNGLGHYDEARAAALRVSEHPEDLSTSNWGLVELIEAAVRAGTPERAAGAHERLARMTRASGTEWALGIAARSSALLADDADAEKLYVEAIERLGRTRLRAERARAHLLYGEWLRRQRRRLDARKELRTAYEMFTEFGMEAFGERARVELLATGEHARRRTIETREDLTPQESQIARLASDGLSNSEIGARLFISKHTVEYHLRKVFAKLGISSRTKLAEVLPRESNAALPP